MAILHSISQALPVSRKEFC